MKIFVKYSLVSLLLLCVISCSTQNNAWLNRNFHAMGTYYNILYHGNLAYEKGRSDVEESYHDNFWKTLPVERMRVNDQTRAAAFGKAKNGMFARAEKKATKAIQKHSILLDGVQYNPQMDEAFLLLGKARYYDQRFVPALSAFNYILDHTKDSLTVIPASIWKAKTQIRMEFPRLAINHLKTLRASRVDFRKEERKGISAVMAQAYHHLGITDSTLIWVDSLIPLTHDKKEKARYLFIKGQLLNNLGKTDSANAVFDRVIAYKRRIPRQYRIHAFMEKAKYFNYKKHSPEQLLSQLQTLAHNRENQKYLANIYFQIGRYYQKTDSIDAAVVYYKKSLKENSLDKYLNSRSYLTLGKINFNRAAYQKAGAYYDSTLANISIETQEYRLLRKRRNNLDDVILYEGIAAKNDSILKLTHMTGAERLAFFTAYTKEIKQKAFDKAVKLMQQAKKAQQNQGQGTFFNQRRQNSNALASGFYFYSQTRVAYGEQAFDQKWGDRKLQDNWRTQVGSAMDEFVIPEAGIKMSEEAIMADLDSNPKYAPKTYLSKIPSEEKTIDSLKKKRDFAYYQLGILYKEQFKEYALAIDKFESLLRYNPEKRLVLPSKYNLYKLYALLGKERESAAWKTEIVEAYPKSRYAAIIMNPASYTSDKNSPMAVYRELYKKYMAQAYQQVIDSGKVYSARFTGEPIVAKFELLKAQAKGKLLGFKAYKKALNFVALNYPLTPEGEKAKELIANTLPALAEKIFVKNDTLGDNHHLVYIFAQNNTKKARQLKKILDKAIKELSFYKFSTSIDVYGPEKIFVVVHGLDNRFEGLRFKEALMAANYTVKKDYFDITSTNYKILLVHKKLKDYLKLNPN